MDLFTYLFFQWIFHRLGDFLFSLFLQSPTSCCLGDLFPSSNDRETIWFSEAFLRIIPVFSEYLWPLRLRLLVHFAGFFSAPTRSENHEDHTSERKSFKGALNNVIIMILLGKIIKSVLCCTFSMSIMEDGEVPAGFQLSGWGARSPGWE